MAERSDCGVCGVPGGIWVRVGEGYFVPRCDDHVKSPAYQAEARLDALRLKPTGGDGDWPAVWIADAHEAKRLGHMERKDRLILCTTEPPAATRGATPIRRYIPDPQGAEPK